MQETRRLINEKFPQAEVDLFRVKLSDESSVEEFYSATVEKFGRIDYGANIAGVAQLAAPIHLSPDEAFDKMYAVNQKAASFCERALIKQFLKQERQAETQLRGSVVIVTSQLEEVTCNGMAAYSASKAGARGISRSDALDYGPEGIRFNTVGPGPTSTPSLLGAQKNKQEILNDEWDVRERESEWESLRSELAEAHLQQLMEGEDGIGRAAF
ncbi:hypothetical protein LTR93_011787 [Exophiala xenobiotica]|nr:hypothetical protein LTR93_011787 [Exophiala xenobiotica]